MLRGVHIYACVLLLAAIASSDPQDDITIHITGPVEVIVSNSVPTAEKCTGEAGFCVETGGRCTGTIKTLCNNNNDHCTCCIPGNSAVSQVEVFIKKKVSILLNRISYRLDGLDTTGLMVFQKNFSELKSLYPVEFSLLEEVYTKVIAPTSTNFVTIVNKLPAANDPAFQKNWAVAMNDIPALFIKLRHRVLDTQIAQNLWSNLFYIPDGPFNMLVRPTFNDIIALIQTVSSLPLDFQEYWRTLQTEVPAISSQFVRRIHDTPILRQIIKYNEYFEKLFGDFYSEEFYIKVIRPTYEDVLAVVQKHMYISNLGYQESIQQYWNVIKEELPTHLNNFKKRLPIRKFMSNLRSIEDNRRFTYKFTVELRNLRRQVYRGAKKLYLRDILSTLDDVVVLVDELVALPVAGIQDAIPKYWDFLDVEVPILLWEFLQRIPISQYMDISFLQNRFTELEARYPIIYYYVRLYYIDYAVLSIKDGSFNLQGKSYKIFKVVLLTWDEAKSKCESEGLIMASEPSDAVELRKYILDNYGDLSSVWLSARGNGSHFIWHHDQHQPYLISDDDELWYTQREIAATTPDMCLVLAATEYYLYRAPNQPYTEWFCASEGDCYTLCEVSM